MARPSTELPSAQAIRALADKQGRLVLRVTPGARIETIELGEGAVLVRVRTRPEAGKANAAALALLASALAIAPSCLRLRRGAAGRDKLVRIDG
jgi:uncharacterized protein